MGNYTIFQMFENPRRGRQARNFCNKCSENSRSQIVFRTHIFRKLTFGAPDVRHLLFTIFARKTACQKKKSLDDRSIYVQFSKPLINSLRFSTTILFLFYCPGQVFFFDQKRKPEIFGFKTVEESQRGIKKYILKPLKFRQDSSSPRMTSHLSSLGSIDLNSNLDT